MSNPLRAPEDYELFLPPDVKHNRIPAPEMSFTRPNLPALIREIESVVLAKTARSEPEE